MVAWKLPAKSSAVLRLIYWLRICIMLSNATAWDLHYRSKTTTIHNVSVVSFEEEKNPHSLIKLNFLSDARQNTLFIKMSLEFLTKYTLNTNEVVVVDKKKLLREEDVSATKIASRLPYRATCGFSILQQSRRCCDVPSHAHSQLVMNGVGDHENNVISSLMLF